MDNNLVPSKNDISVANSLFVHFRLCNKSYAVYSEYTIEIIRLPKLDYPQKLPKYIIGLLNYNDVSINVVDLRAILELGSEKFQVSNQLIILKTQESILAFIVDEVVDIISIPQDKMTPVPYSSSNLITMLFHQGDNLISILDLFAVENILKENQYSDNDINYELYFPNDNDSLEIFNKRACQLVKNNNNVFLPSAFNQDQFLVFYLGDNLYCINLKYVRELVEVKNVLITKLPFAPVYLEGITNLRGDFVSVVNLKTFLDNKSESTSNEKKIIVVDAKDYKIAFLVDEIQNITSISQDKYIHRSKNKFISKFILAEIIEDDSIINILNMEKLLNDEKMFINLE